MNEPIFLDSSILRLFGKCKVSSVQLALRSVQFEMCKNGDWNFRGVPDIGSVSNYVQHMTENSTQTEVDVLVQCIKDHAGSYRESFRYQPEGVASNSKINMKQIENDLTILVDCLDTREEIYEYGMFK